jgi:hypothetical protein
MIKKLEQILKYEKNIFYFCFSLSIVFFVNFTISGWWIKFITVDPWLYWGTSQNYEYFLEHFSDTYYFRRWTLIYPFIACQWILNPGMSYFFIANLSLFFSSFFFLKISFKISKDNLTGIFLIILILLSSSQHILNKISSPHVTFFSIPLFLIIFYNCYNICTENKFSNLNIIIIFFLIGILNITFQGYFFFSAIFYFIILLFYKKKNFDLKQLHLNIIFAAIVVFAIDFLVGKLSGANWKNLITYSLSVYLELSKHQVWGERLAFENYSLDKFIGIGLILNTVLFIFLKKKNKIQNNQDIFFQYFSILIFILFYLIQLISYNPYSWWGHGFIIVHLSFFFIILYLLKNQTIVTKIIFFISFSIFLFFNNNFKSEDIRTIEIIIFFILLFLTFKKHITNNFKHVIQLIILITVLLNMNKFLDKSLIKKSFNNLMLIDVIFKNNKEYIEQINIIADQVKEVSKYNSKFRVWLLDNRDKSQNHQKVPLLASLYYQYSMFNNYDGLDICKQIDWMFLFKNSIILAIGFENQESAIDKIKEMTKECNEIIIKNHNAKYNIGYSFYLNYK